jgi:molecular chaperone GrpE (heat shock protein)
MDQISIRLNSFYDDVLCVQEQLDNLDNTYFRNRQVLENQLQKLQESVAKIKSENKSEDIQLKCLHILDAIHVLLNPSMLE